MSAEQRTITESELEKASGLLPGHGRRISPEELRHALDRIGVETVPDPMPEPGPGTVVEDRRGVLWKRTETPSDHTWLSPSGNAFSWETLLDDFGVLRVYRAEEVAPDGR